MSDFKVKMHQSRLSLGLRPRPVEELRPTELPGPLAISEGSTSKRREKEREEWEGNEK